MPRLNLNTFRTTPAKTARSTLDTDRLALRKKVYSKARWQRLKKLYLSDHPLCEVCLARGKYVPATHVHHKYSFTLCTDYSTAMAVAFDPDNLCSICDRCHGIIHHQCGQTNGQTPEDMAKIVEKHGD